MFFEGDNRNFHERDFDHEVGIDSRAGRLWKKTGVFDWNWSFFKNGKTVKVLGVCHPKNDPFPILGFRNCFQLFSILGTPIIEKLSVDTSRLWLTFSSNYHCSQKVTFLQNGWFSVYLDSTVIYTYLAQYLWNSWIRFATLKKFPR